jgi:peptide/nickel transport system permease protein
MMKGKYFIKRLLAAVPTFFGITLLCYVVSSMAPGSPLDSLLLDPYITTEQLDLMRHQLGLDQPVLVQYLSWLWQFLHGNLGFSFRTARPVWVMILERLGPTLMISCASVVLSLLVAVPLGIMAAAKPYSLRDYGSSGLSFVLASTPNFFAGLALIYLLAVTFGLLPSGGMYDSSGEYRLGDLVRHMILPTLVLSFQQMGSWIRYVRSSMLEVMQEDYIRTARAKGLKRRVVILKHGLKNSLIPVVTVVGMSIPTLVGGAVVTEQIFTWPGIGLLMVASIQARDYPVIMGITVVVAATVLIANIFIDFVYGVLDPRIRYS